MKIAKLTSIFYMKNYLLNPMEIAQPSSVFHSGSLLDLPKVIRSVTPKVKHSGLVRVTPMGYPMDSRLPTPRVTRKDSHSDFPTVTTKEINLDSVMDSPILTPRGIY